MVFLSLLGFPHNSVSLYFIGSNKYISLFPIKRIYIFIFILWKILLVITILTIMRFFSLMVTSMVASLSNIVMLRTYKILCFMI